ncbi:hypothetical protein ABG088_12245 [Hydrogenibacillus schlegelii]
MRLKKKAPESLRRSAELSAGAFIPTVYGPPGRRNRSVQTRRTPFARPKGRPAGTDHEKDSERHSQTPSGGGTLDSLLHLAIGRFAVVRSPRGEGCLSNILMPPAWKSNSHPPLIFMFFKHSKNQKPLSCTWKLGFIRF